MIVVDNFLPDNDWAHFNNEDNWKFRHKNTWVDINHDPEYFYEGLSRMIWNFFAPDHSKWCAGYEYWTNILSKSVQMGWHQDKDEALYKLNGDIVVPIMGSVLYAEHDNLEGGYLELEGKEIERIAPIPNRLVIFNAAEFHRVSDITQGTRRVFACNLWNRKLIDAS